MLLFVVKFISANRHFAWHILYNIKTFIVLSFDVEHCAKFSHIMIKIRLFYYQDPIWNESSGYYWVGGNVSFHIHHWNKKGTWIYSLYMNICIVLMRANCLLQWSLVPCSKDVEGEGKPLRHSSILTLIHIFEDKVWQYGINIQMYTFFLYLKIQNSFCPTDLKKGSDWRELKL